MKILSLPQYNEAKTLCHALMDDQTKALLWPALALRMRDLLGGVLDACDGRLITTVKWGVQSGTSKALVTLSIRHNDDSDMDLDVDCDIDIDPMVRVLDTEVHVFSQE